MKAVLLSVRHQHIVDMHTGKKTSELRTKFPKITTPFKVYNLDTVSSGGCGKVVSEWECKDITEWLMYMGIPAHLSKVACVSNEHIWEYCNKGEKNIGEMKITNLVIYDKPKELSEFSIIDNTAIKKCEHRERVYNNPTFTNGACLLGGYVCNKGEIVWCSKCKMKLLLKPPQSWCYVEELG